MPTRPHDAYLRGRDDRKKYPDAKSCDEILPYAIHNLTVAWLDGWRDEAGDYHWYPGGQGPPVPVPWGVEGGLCPKCGGMGHVVLSDGTDVRGMTTLPDGILRCMLSPCRERNYPPIDRARLEEIRAWRRYRLELAERCST